MSETKKVTPTPLRKMEDPTEWHVLPSRAATETKKGPKATEAGASADLALMPPPSAKKGRKRRRVLSEEDFLAGLEAIIERDFHPDLQRMREYNGWLRAARYGDDDEVRQVFERIAAEEAVAHSASPAVPDAPDMPLREYLQRYTSEDNESYAELQERAQEEHRRKYWWAYGGADRPVNRPGVADEKLLLLPDGSQLSKEQRKELDRLLEDRPRQRDAGRPPQEKQDTWRHRVRNAIFFPPDAAAARDVHGLEGGTKADHDGGKMPLKDSRVQALGPAADADMKLLTNGADSSNARVGSSEVPKPLIQLAATRGGLHSEVLSALSTLTRESSPLERPHSVSSYADTSDDGDLSVGLASDSDAETEAGRHAVPTSNLAIRGRRDREEEALGIADRRRGFHVRELPKRDQIHLRMEQESRKRRATRGVSSSILRTSTPAGASLSLGYGSVARSPAPASSLRTSLRESSQRRKSTAMRLRDMSPAAQSLARRTGVGSVLRTALASGSGRATPERLVQGSGRADRQERGARRQGGDKGSKTVEGLLSPRR